MCRRALAPDPQRDCFFSLIQQVLANIHRVSPSRRGFGTYRTARTAGCISIPTEVSAPTGRRLYPHAYQFPPRFRVERATHSSGYRLGCLPCVDVLFSPLPKGKGSSWGCRLEHRRTHGHRHKHRHWYRHMHRRRHRHRQ